MLTQQEKLDLNLYNGVLLGKDPIFEMYVMSMSRGGQYGYHGIDDEGINFVFDWYAKLIYERQRLLFIPLYSRDKRGRFTKRVW